MTTPPPYVPVLRVVPLLLLDMDGTIRHGFDELGRFVNGPEDVKLFNEAIARMREWKQAGGRIAVVSNQGGIALGKVSHEAVGAAMTRTAQLAGELPNGDFDEALIDVIVWCEHHPDSGKPSCWCRKPRTGLIFEAIRQLTDRYAGTEVYPPGLAVMVGDRAEDAQCAESVDIPFVWADEWRAGAINISGENNVEITSGNAEN